MVNLLLLRVSKKIFSIGSSIIFNKALIEFAFKNSILSINTNLGLLLKEDLFKFNIKFLIWDISIDFFCLISIKLKLILYCLKLIWMTYSFINQIMIRIYGNCSSFDKI